MLGTIFNYSLLHVRYCPALFFTWIAFFATYSMLFLDLHYFSFLIWFYPSVIRYFLSCLLLLFTYVGLKLFFMVPHFLSMELFFIIQNSRVVFFWWQQDNQPKYWRMSYVISVNWRFWLWMIWSSKFKL